MSEDGSAGTSEQGARNAGALLFAISRGKTKTALKLLDAGVDVNASDYDSRAAIHVAAGTGSVEFLELLVSRGANVNAKDRWGHTPVDDALSGNHVAAVEYLQSKGGEASQVAVGDIGNARRATVTFASTAPLDPSSSLAMLLTAAADGDVVGVKRLFDNNECTPDSCDYDKRTAAHLAASEGRLEVLKFLVDRGANLNMIDRFGNRCLNDALRGGHSETISFLRQNGAEESLADIEDVKPRDGFALKQASKEEMAALHRRGVREFWALDHDDFEIEATPFAKGAGGEVFHARWRELACVAKTCGKLTTSEQTLNDLANEISLMATVRHPNIVLFFGACFQLSPPVLLLEYCPLGNLESRIMRSLSTDAKSHEKLSFAHKLRYAHELALGMNFLHRCTIPIIHRDLKPQNVLISSEDSIKITDFGLAKYMPHKNRHLEDKFTMTGETGSYRYMAPEVFTHKPYNQTVDVYSYALIMYWLFSGTRPFYNISDPIKAVKHAALDSGRPPLSIVRNERVKALLERMWAQDPDKRPSFGIVSKFFEELREDYKESAGSSCSTM